MTRAEARQKIRDPLFLAKVKRLMKEQYGMGRANVNPEIVSALVEALEVARESNQHNFAVAQDALLRAGETE